MYNNNGKILTNQIVCVIMSEISAIGTIEKGEAITEPLSMSNTLVPI